MKLHNFSDEGIILKRNDFSEADRILVIFSKNHGKVSVLAKGVRKLTSRKRGHIESFSHIRYSATLGSGMSVITETETINNFEAIRQDLKRIAVAYFFLETVNKITNDQESHPHVFDLLLDYLLELETSSKLKALRTEFTRKILVELGFWDAQKQMINSDQVLENVIERKLSSIRVGKKLIN